MGSETRTSKRRRRPLHIVNDTPMLSLWQEHFPKESITFSGLRLKNKLAPLICITPEEKGQLMEVEFAVIGEQDEELHVIFDQLIDYTRLEGALSFGTLQQILECNDPRDAAEICVDMFIAETGKLIIKLSWNGVEGEIYFELTLPGLEQPITATIPFDDKAKKIFEATRFCGG